MKQEHLSRSGMTLIIIALMASLLLSALDSTIVGTAMKTIINELQGMGLYAWPFTIYMLTSTIIIPISGGLADLFGRKPVFLAGVLFFLAGSVLCGLSHSMMALIVSRGIQGIGSGVLTTSVFTIVADLFPPQLRGKYMGIVTSVYGLASIVGPLIGGIITDNFSWRWIFYINVPIGVVAVILIVLFMPNFKTPAKAGKVDYLGSLFVVLALVPMLLGFSFAGSTYAWGSVQVIGLLGLSAVMLTVFVFAEAKAANPIIPLSFFKDRSIWITLLVGFLSNAVMFAAIMYIPYFVQGVLGTSATASGAVTVPMTVALMITSNIIGFFMTHNCNLFRRLTILAFALTALGMFLLSTMNTGTTYISVIIYMIILGGGIGITMPVTNTNVQNAAPVEQLAAVTGAMQFFRSIGSTVGSAIYGTLMTSAITRGFLSLDLSRVPDNIQSSLRNPQVITDSAAVSQIIGKTPPEQLNAVRDAVAQAKNVLSSGIHDVFFFCAAAAVFGIVLSFWFKNAPMQPVHAPSPKNGPDSVRSDNVRSDEE